MSPTTTTQAPLRPDRIMQLVWGFAPPLIIGAAVKHRVFDVLDAKGPLTLEQLSRETGTSSRGLRAIANVLVALEFLAKNASGRYALTPESAAFLVSTKPSFQGGLFKHVATQLIPKWTQIDECVRTGRPAAAVNQEGEGAAFFQDLVEDIFPMSYAAARALGDALGLPKADRSVKVLDLAAGSGVWGVALAQKSPRVTVTAVDWPGVIPVTRRVAERHGVADRFRYVEGDLATADFGAGHDVATLGHILHSEGEARSRDLLRKTFAAMAPGGTIAIAEFVANDERTGPPHAMIFAVNMLVNCDAGDTFTFAEMSAWLKEAGFANPRQLDVQAGPSPLILADKPRS